MAQAEDPHVGDEVALAIEEGGVAALVGLERLDVVRNLALQVLGGVRSLDQQLAALGAVEEACALAHRPVLAVELDRVRCASAMGRL